MIEMFREILTAINLTQSQNGISDYILSFGGNTRGVGNADFLYIENHPLLHL